MEDLHLGSSSKQKKSGKLFLDVATSETETRKFVISIDSSVLLKKYASFFSEVHGKKVTEDNVLDALISKLREDKDFLKWKQKESN